MILLGALGSPRDLYSRVFARILSREDAKASPYARYYIAISTPMSWEHIMTVFSSVLESKGKLEDAAAHSIPVSVVPPSVRVAITLCSYASL